MYNVSFFNEELMLIKDDDLRGMVTEVLECAPKWFWIEPASLSGRHHPPDDLVEGGIAVHTKKVAWLAHKYFDAFNEDTDVGVASALVHDIRSRGAGDEVGTIDDYKRHADAGEEYLREFGLEEFSYGAKCQDKWAKVCVCVGWHMGRYESDGRLPPSIQPQLLHLADLGASFRLLVGLPFYTDDLPKINDVMEASQKFVKRDNVWVFNFGKQFFRKPVMDVMKTQRGRDYFDWMLKAGFDNEVCVQVKQFQKDFADAEKKRRQLESGNLPL